MTAPLPPYSVRQLVRNDAVAIEQLFSASPWNFAHFATAETAHIVATRPGVGIFEPPADALMAWIIANSVVGSIAWLGGFGVPWSAHKRAFDLLDLALPLWYELLCNQGVQHVYYAGNDESDDWLRDPLLQRGFQPVTQLRAYEKFGTAGPAQGNQEVRVRSFVASDMAGVLAIEQAAFVPLWRHDAREFDEIAATYPFFVVAVGPDGSIAGYLCSMVDAENGYLVRIAVLPAWQGRGVGARLMAETMGFFAEQGVSQVLLNAEETNTPAHRLYERWGFAQMVPRGFVLGRQL